MLLVEGEVGMSRQGLMQRFAVLRTGRREPTAATGRRPDFKGTRARLNLRVSVDVLEELMIIKTATGVDKNAFCVDVLVKAIRGRVDKLKTEHDAADWAVISRCAKRLR
jgi:hypothetical protein